MHSTFVVTVLYCGQESFNFCNKILYLFYGPVALSGTLACSMRRLQFGNCQTCCRFFFYCRFRFFSLQFIIWAECYWIGNPPPLSPLTLSLFHPPYQRLRLIYSSSFAGFLDLLEIKPYSSSRVQWRTVSRHSRVPWRTVWRKHVHIPAKLQRSYFYSYNCFAVL